MAGTAGSGGSMDYEYDSPDQHGSYTSRPSRCPALNNYLTISSSGLHPHHLQGPPPHGHTFHRYDFDDPSRIQQRAHLAESSFGWPALPLPNFCPPTPTLPDYSVPLAQSVHSHRGRPNFNSSNVGSSAPVFTTPAPFVPSLGIHTGFQHSTIDQPPAPSPVSSQANSSSSSSMPSPAPVTHADSAQREGQSSSGRPPASNIQLPAPSNGRQRLPGDRRSQPLSTSVRPRETDYGMSMAFRAGALPLSDDYAGYSDRTLGWRSPGVTRHPQFRSRIDGKRVASKRAIQSLVKVDPDCLDGTEKNCVICYNDFGVASPEGVVETPLRLPKCKHVFGNMCIIRWLEDNYSCPYCRDTLESEMAPSEQEVIHRLITAPELNSLHSVYPSTRRAYSRTDRFQPSATSDGPLSSSSNWVGVRTVTGDHQTPADASTTARGERRAAPSEDANDAQRRQRPRFENHHSDFYSQYPPALSTQRPLPEPRPAQPTLTQGQSFHYMPHIPWSLFDRSRDSPQPMHQLPPVTVEPMRGPHHPGSPPDSHQRSSRSDFFFLNMQPSVGGSGHLAGPTHPLSPWLPSPGSMISERQLPVPSGPTIRSPELHDRPQDRYSRSG